MTAIALVSVFFLAYAVQSFYPSPKYGDYCGEIKQVNNSKDCKVVGGLWNSENVRSPVLKEWCDTEFSCREDFNSAKTSYERNVFFINSIIGLAVLITSVFLAVEVVASGLMAGGTIMIIYGTLRYWGNLSNGWRTLMLGIALGILVYVGYKKFK